jgi:hypothetical protein
MNMRNNAVSAARLLTPEVLDKCTGYSVGMGTIFVHYTGTIAEMLKVIKKSFPSADVRIDTKPQTYCLRFWIEEDDNEIVIFIEDGTI